MSDALRDLQGEHVDYLVVGGGSAGCVLAARLSEDPRNTVLLVEAGQDFPEHAMPAELRSSYPNKAYFIREFFFPDFMVRLGDVPSAKGERALSRYKQAKVLGGGSTINGLCANRGAPADYDDWVSLGAEGWGWDEVFPYFRKLERDLDFGGDLHGKDGPVPMRRLPPELVSGFVKQTTKVLTQHGIPEIADQNGVWQDGVMPVATNIDEAGHRASSATCYLTPAARARANLKILAGCEVRKLLVQDGAVIGVAADGEAGPVRITARETIVCCGAIQTPTLLMRSGFGPGELLRRAGVAVARDLPGVGENLQEHPAVGLSCFVRPGHRLAEGIFHQQSHVRFSSGLDGCPPTDMSMSLLARSAWHRVGGQIATYYIWVNRSYSRGHVRLDPSDASAPPEVDFRLLSDPRDLTRLRAGLRRIAAVALDPEMDKVRTEVFPTVFSARVQSVSRPGAWNAARTAALAAILDVAGFARRRLIHTLIAPKDLGALLADDAVLDEYMHAAVAGTWHASGSCRMGRADDPLAVTDPQGRVHNVPGLRVCDASLMPMVPCANTNIPTIMMAERIADLMKEGRARAAD